MKKRILKIIPYFLSFCFGIMIFIISFDKNEYIKSLLLNISASFIALPLLYMVYELTKKVSKKRLNKEIFEYAKMQIDRELLNICHQLIKLIYPYEKQNNSFEGINKLLELNDQNLKNEFAINRYLGFQVLKNWYVTEQKIQNLLDSSFIINKLNDDQVIAIINILKNIRFIQDINRNINNLYVTNDIPTKEYIVQNGIELNKDNVKYPDRYLLLKKIDNEKFQVFDFGDFEKYKIKDLLKMYRLDPKYLNMMCEAIITLNTSIKEWLKETESEILVDTRMYKIKK